MGKYKHGMDGTKLHRLWCHMRERCSYEKYSHYDNYGGRGITFAEEWKEFLPFYHWAMANGYQEGLTLDRIDPNGNYEPGNCRFTTNLQQQRNKRNNHFVNINGETKTLSEWSEMTGIPPKTLRHRVVNGWDEKDLLNPVYEAKRIKVNGEETTFYELSKVTGIKVTTLMNRYEILGWRDDKLIQPVKRKGSK